MAHPGGHTGVPPDEWMRWMLSPLVPEAWVGLPFPTTPTFSLSPFPHPSSPSPFSLNILSLPTSSQLLSRHPVTVVAAPVCLGLRTPAAQEVSSAAEVERRGALKQRRDEMQLICISDKRQLSSHPLNIVSKTTEVLFLYTASL